MADSWGIDHTYVDGSNQRREVSADTIERLRGAFGTPGGNEGPLILKAGSVPRQESGEVVLEDGTILGPDRIDPDSLPPGYHQIIDAGGGQRSLIVTPGTCHLPDDLRSWGWVSQLYATRSTRSWGIGDLADLRQLARWSTAQGAGFVLINPINAVAPTPEQQASPYFPASRRYHNPLYLAIDDVPGSERASDDLERAARAGRALNVRREIDHDAVWAIKLAALEAIWSDSPPSSEFERWLETQPESLWKFAVWSVLVERYGASWREWPPTCRRPDGDGIAEIGRHDRERVRFHAWLQWCLQRQLGAVGRETTIIQDLPIGFDPNGFDAWEWQHMLALEASVGAPPDAFNLEGQNWGSPPFIPWRLRAADHRPFIETIRANLAIDGGLRIDHVMGLFRLWCIPSGSSARDGAYVRYPAEELLAILAVESQRAGALVIGEDLGTVEEGVRETLSDHDILSYRLLWFEGKPPHEWPEKAMAAVTTHDLPTVAGLWDDSDIATRRRFGMEVDEEGTKEIRRRLTEAGGLDERSTPEEAVVAAYQQLSRAPSRLLAATLEDAVSETERPNMPGASDRLLNWRLALPVPLEELESHPLAQRISKILQGATAPRRRKDSDV